MTGQAGKYHKVGKIKSDTPLKRRDILKSAGIGLVAGGSLISTAGIAAGDTGQTLSWDREVDVICVGTGAAALSAAVVARQKGANVLLVEKMPMTGGTTRRSGGIAWIPNNKFLRKRGIVDEKDACIRYMARHAAPGQYSPDAKYYGLPELDYRRLEALYDHGAKMVDDFDRMKALRFQEFTMWGLGELSPDYADGLPENKVRRGRAIETAAADGNDTGISQGGASMVAQLQSWLTKNDVPILLRHRVRKILKQDQRVIGIEVESPEGVIRIKARRGLVFGTGGFAHNVDLVSNQRYPIYGACAATSSTGDFIEIASQAGARIGALDTAWRTQVMLEDALKNRSIPWAVFVLPGDSMIMVNKYGRRVVNESLGYDERTTVHFDFDLVKREYPNRYLFWLFDQRTLDSYGGAYPIPGDVREQPNLISGKSADELAANIRTRLRSIAERYGKADELAPDFASRLKETIRIFNGYARTGKDLDFNRGDQDFDKVWNRAYSAMRENPTKVENPYPNPCMHPLSEDGPYHAFILAPGALDTCAGPKVNEKAEVLDYDDQPIAGLYAAGNCIASPTQDAYFGAGSTLGAALTYGYIAGHSIMAQKEAKA